MGPLKSPRVGSQQATALAQPGRMISRPPISSPISNPLYCLPSSAPKTALYQDGSLNQEKV